MVVDSRVTHPNVIPKLLIPWWQIPVSFDKGPKRHRGTRFDRGVTPFCSLHSTQTVLSKAFAEEFIWMLVLMKTKPKIGDSQTDIFSTPFPRKWQVGQLLGYPIFYTHWLYSFAQAKQWRHPTSAIFGSVRWRQTSPGIEFSLELGGWFCHWSHMRLMYPTTVKPNNGSS